MVGLVERLQVRESTSVASPLKKKGLLREEGFDVLPKGRHSWDFLCHLGSSFHF